MKTLVKGGRIIDVSDTRIYESDILINNNVIEKIDRIGKIKNKIDNMIDAKDYFLVPGLIDAHAHNEMTMLSPVSFAQLVLRGGTSAAIFDCHDLANVIGMRKAMNYMKREFGKTELKAFYAIPSCIPPSLNETSGSVSKLEDVLDLFNQKDVIALGEVMDIHRVLQEEKELMRMINYARKKGIRIDGHAPTLSGKKLTEYIIISGASTEHEFSDLDEAIERAEKGMKIILRRGIVKEPNAYEIYKKVKEKENLMLSADGCTTINNILNYGYIDFALREIMKEGIPAIDAIKMATINTARHYRLEGIGELKKGNYADILFVSDLQKLKIEKVMVNGKFFGDEDFEKKEIRQGNLAIRIKRKPVKLEELVIKSKKKEENVRVIKLVKSLETEEEIFKLKCNGFVNSNLKKDILYASVINRYNENGKVVNGFVRGFGLRSGAICCSNGQDSQNIIVIGANHQDMQEAVNHVIKNNGGCFFVINNRVVGYFDLPIAGIMNNNRFFPEKVFYLENKLRENGGKENLLFFMPMLSCSSIPHLRITDKGLYNADLNKFQDVVVK